MCQIFKYNENDYKEIKNQILKSNFAEYLLINKVEEFFHMVSSGQQRECEIFLAKNFKIDPIFVIKLLYKYSNVKRPIKNYKEDPNWKYIEDKCIQILKGSGDFVQAIAEAHAYREAVQFDECELFDYRFVRNESQ